MNFNVGTRDERTIQFPLDSTSVAITEKILQETLCKSVQTAKIVLKQNPDFFTEQLARNYIYHHLAETIEKYSINADENKRNNWCLSLYEFFKENITTFISPDFSPEKLTRNMFPEKVFEEITNSIESITLQKN